MRAALSLPAAPVQPNAWLRIGTDGSITFLSDKSEMGQGVYTSLPTLIAEELDVPVESIRVEAAPAGADVHEHAARRAGHRRQHERARGLGQAAQAGAEARQRLTAAAAEHWGVAASELRAENGAVVRGDGARLTYGELATAAAALPVPGRRHGEARERLLADRQGAHALRHGVEDQRHGRVRHRPALSEHAVRRARAVPGARRQGASVHRRAGSRDARRAPQSCRRRAASSCWPIRGGRRAKRAMRSTSSGTRAERGRQQRDDLGRPRECARDAQRRSRR